MLNDIYNSGYLPRDMLKSVIIAIPKRPVAIECEDFRTINLINHATKLLLRIIMRRTRKKIKMEISEEQYGFMEGKGTNNAIYILRTLIERSIEKQKDIYLCFIDYTKAFDKVKHDELIKMLEDINIDRKDLRIIKNIYWNQVAAIKRGNKEGSYEHIKLGVRQGCVLSPDLFSLYSEVIMREIKEKPGILIGGFNINNIRYADDTVLVGDDATDLQQLLDIVVTESAKKGLSLNIKKTVTMVISKKLVTPKCDIEIEGKILNQVDNFKYLGAFITSDGRCTTEIKSRIGQAKAAFNKMKSILCNKSLSMNVRNRVLKCYIEPVLLYGSESWNINEQIRKNLEATEMWFLRQMLRIPWTARVTNNDCLKEANETRTLYTTIRKRQTTFFGHVMRRETLENIVTTGKIEEKGCNTCYSCTC